MHAVNILGCRVDAVGRREAIERIAALAAHAPGSLVVTLGVEMVMRAQHDERFRRIVNAAALNVCDTIGLLLASRVRRGPLRERVTGVELVADLAARSATMHDVRLYFLGSRGDTAVRAARELQRRFPGATICGSRDGYFAADDSEGVAQSVAASGANVLCVGLGSPKQEMWLSRYGAATGCVGIGIGGTLDVLAGTVRRAPQVITAAGFEWLYRLVCEPQRWRRQLVLPQFVVAVACETLRLHLRSARG